MASAKWNEVNRKPDEINELILKTKTYLKERPDNNIMVILGLCFLLTDWLSFREGEKVRLKLDVQGQEGGRILDVVGQGGWGVFLARYSLF